MIILYVVFPELSVVAQSRKSSVSFVLVNAPEKERVSKMIGLHGGNNLARIRSLSIGTESGH